MIVDAHAHVWKADPKYPNPAVTTVSPASEVPLDLLRQYMDQHGVGRTVLVQPMFPGEDNSLVADAACAEPERFAAVAVVDPRAPERLEYWVKERGCRGLRMRPSFAGEEELFEHDPLWAKALRLRIVISVLAKMPHVAAIARRAERFPGVPLIVDHLAHPDVAAGVGSPEFQALLALAKFPNVSVKPTGFYYYSKQGYPYDDCADFFRAAYDSFGPDRLIWGSDFPHVLLKTDYGRTLRLFEDRYPWLTKGERDKILGANAEGLYFASTHFTL
jgi:predicted TIM-barrel fold metal-dependent hydrolase